MRLIQTSAALALFLSLLPAAARAQQQDNAATVEALFADGKKLMAEGKTAEACPKFLASYTLENRVGTLLNLATCYEKNGQFASAWARFVEAKTLASRNNQSERAAFATQHAAALESRRSTLTIVVNSSPPGLVVKRDGVVVDPAAYGVAVPVDGGSHTIEASAPDKKSVTSTMTIAAEADKKTYTLTALLDALPEAAAAPIEAPAPAAGSAPPPARSATRTVVGGTLAGLGVVSAGIGIAFGVEALSKNSDSNANGNCNGNVCNSTGFNARNAARSDGDISSVLIGAGAAAVVGGAVLWLMAPKGGSPRAGGGAIVVGIGPTGVDVRGVF
jgi:hypothetical protein